MGSTRPKPPGVTEIFSEYVRQRKSGRSQQQVVEFLKPMLARLRPDARQQLVALLRSWEAREGAKFVAEAPSPPARKLDPLLDAEELTAPPKPGEDLSWLQELEATAGEQPAAPRPAAPAADPPALNINSASVLTCGSG